MESVRNVNDSQDNNTNISANGGKSGDNPDMPPATEERYFIARQVTGRTRFVATVPALGLLVASLLLAIGTLIDLVAASFSYIIGDIDLHSLCIAYVEYADLFLLAVALYILSIGLVNLFVSEQIALPKWLEFHDFDDLKQRLTGVIIVMIGVYFLGYVLKGANGIDTLWIGLACAAVIIALSFFVRSVFKSDK